jgi:hypothetical protein
VIRSFVEGFVIMSLINLLSNLNIEKLDKSTIEMIISDHPQLSNTDKKKLLLSMSKYKEQDHELTLKTILLYSIWEPDTAIKDARYKGVFRYVAYGFKQNSVQYLLEKILLYKDLFKYSEKTLRYLNSKLLLCWLYDYYRDCEKKIISTIKASHETRRRERRGDIILETAIFKDLLVYIDFRFNSNLYISDEQDKNSLGSFSNEEVSEGISYIIFLYDKIIGIKSDINYMINADFILSDDIEKIVLLACKMIKMQEWELHTDFLSYEINLVGHDILIFDPSTTFEKSIMLGYINNQMQEELLYYQGFKSFKNTPNEPVTFTDIIDITLTKLGEDIIEDIDDGNLSRFRFKFPEPLLKSYNSVKFVDEILTLMYHSKEYFMDADELAKKKITSKCTVEDILLFQRPIRFMNAITNSLLKNEMNKKNRKKVLQSLVPHMTYAGLKQVISTSITDSQKVDELIELFTFKNKYKLDLQYTPFITASQGVYFPSTIIAKSNMVRNSIAYSHMINNQVVNDDDGLEPLVKTCAKYFDNAGYKTLTNKKFVYHSQKGEVDVIVETDTDLILIECKSPLLPVNLFEMRASIEHIEKANSQLDLSQRAFKDPIFYKDFYKNNGISIKKRNIYTCIIFGNRLFSGFKESKHPIRYVHELSNVLEKGVISSDFGTWSIWESDNYQHKDLINYLNNDTAFSNYTFDAMYKKIKSMHIKGYKVSFASYALNVIEAFKIYDKNLRIIEKKEEAREEINRRMQAAGYDYSL